MQLGGKLFGLSVTIFEITKYAAITVIVIILVIVFLGVPLSVSGQSMEPNFHDKEIVLVQRLSYAGSKTPKRGDVVAAKFPADAQHTRLIKRVIGLPGDKVTVSGDHYYINGELLNERYDTVAGDPPYTPIDTVTLKAGEYFLSGDNRPGSSDSRLWGPVQRSDIEGKISFVIYPIKNLEYVLSVN